MGHFVRWTQGSRHKTLQSFDTSVDTKLAFTMAPSPIDKSGMAALTDSLKPETLLRAFHDGLLQADFVKERKRFTTALYSLACTAASGEEAA